MGNGLSYGDSVLMDGERVDFTELRYIYEGKKCVDVVLRGGRYSASTNLLDISGDAGRHRLITELENVEKVGVFKGKTLAKYLKMYLDGIEE